MKKILTSFYGKISAVFLVLLLLLGGMQIYFTLQSSSRFIHEADQKLNLPLAQHMALELQPLVKDSLSLPQIEEKIHYMMVLNPKIEIYLLDSQGKILAFFADPKKKVQAQFVDLQPIRKFIGGAHEELILGADPRHKGRYKPFSAAPIRIGNELPGYLYIILSGEQYDNAAQMIENSYIVRNTVRSLLLTLLFTGFIGLIMFALLTRRLRKMTEVVTNFEQGNRKERIPVKSQDEISQLAISFNKMADTIATNIEQLQQTDKLRRELIANVSHDLRSPLASIQGYVETILMKKSALSESEQEKYLQIILSNTTSLSQLVEELFQLSKLDARQVKANPEPFSIAELVQDVVMKFNPQAKARHIHLKAIQPGKMPLVYADIGLIERVLSNLLKNALQFTPPEGIVKVVLSNANGNVRVTISDSGQGIPSEDLPYIFDRFFRVKKSRSGDGSNSGLGLAIARKILELHQSQIFVESELNVGTKFYFNLNVWKSKKI